MNPGELNKKDYIRLYNTDITTLFKGAHDRHMILQTIELSKNMSRTENEDATLHSNINLCAQRAQRGSYNSKKTLVIVFYPIIIKTSTRYYDKYFRNTQYFSRMAPHEVVQESYMCFEECIKQYKPGLAGFTYYISITFKLRVARKLNKIRYELGLCQLFSSIADSQTIDRLYYKNDTIINQIIGKLLLEDIKAVMEKVKRRARTKTAETVCDLHYFKGKTCAEIAEQLGISYNAIDEVIDRINKMIANMVNQNNEYGYSITLESGSLRKYKITKALNRPHIDQMLLRQTCNKCAKVFKVRLKSVITENTIVCSHCLAINPYTNTNKKEHWMHT